MTSIIVFVVNNKYLLIQKVNESNNNDHFLRVVKKIESSRRDRKSNGRFRNFCNACKIELCASREAGAFIGVDSEICWLPGYFDNPAFFKCWCI